MMKRTLLFTMLLILVLGVFSSLNARVEITIGDGTDTNTTTGAPAPYGTWYKAFRQQLLYRADDFLAAGAAPGLISALSFNVQDLDTSTPMTNYTIRLKLTDQEALSTTFELGEYTTVWQSNEFMPTTGWNLHTFMLPFLWDGTANLLVDISTDIVTGSYAHNALSPYSTMGYNSSLRFQSDTANGSTGTTGATSMNRSNIRFIISPPSTDPVFVVSPATKDFGDVVLGCTASQAFRVMNAGSGTLTINNIYISGNTQFSLADLPTLPIQLGLGTHLDFNAIYTPTAAGDFAATIHITDNLRQSHTVALSGHGVDTSIYELSHAENFDAVSIPALPMGWNSIYQATATTGYVKTLTTSPQSAPNCVGIYNPVDINTIAMLIAPPLASAIPINNVRVKLWGKGNNYSLKVGVMTDPANAATFTEIETLTLTSAWAQYQVSLTSYTGTGKFIAFKHANNAMGQIIYVDTVEFEMMGANDLAARALSGNSAPNVATATQYTVSVYNNGTATQNSYALKLYDGNNVELASVPGPSIAAGATIDVALTWTPTTEGPMSIYAKVILPGDINPGNDATSPIPINVQPEGMMSITIGEGNLNVGVPWEFYYRHSLFQTLYYPTEIGTFGNITAISFYNSFSTELIDMPVTLWLGTTMLEDLSAGWINPNTLVQVFEGYLTFPDLTNTITVPLQVPFSYTGGNLVLYALRPLDTMDYGAENNFLGQTLGNNRARKLQSDSNVYDPMAPSAAGTLSGTFPKTTFMMTPLSPDPVLIVNPLERNFGEVILGQSAAQEFFITNAGGGTLGLSSINIGGDDAAAFSLSELPALPVSLNTGELATFTLSFSPTAAGEHSAIVSLVDDTNRQTHTVELSGTGFDPSIYALPILQTWDNVSIPDFPLGWSKILNSSATNSYLRTSSSAPFSAPNCVQFSNGSDPAAELILISPLIDDGVDISSIRVKLMAKGGTNFRLQIGTIVDLNNPATFELAEELSVLSGWHEYVVELSEYTGTGRYIAFRHASNSPARTIYIDDLSFEEIAPNDLAATAINGNAAPSVSILSTYTIDVFNNGTAPQSEYSVKLMSGDGTELASQMGPLIAAGETLPVQIAWTPSTEGPMSLIGKVVLAGDVNSMNDETLPMSLVVQPENVVSITVGEGNQLSGVPWEFYNRHSLFQTLYYQNEINIFGQITGVQFFNNFVSNLSNIPVKLWLGTTLLENLSSGWVDPNTLTLVYDGNLNFPSQENTITVPLQLPFDYTEGNLVLYALRSFDTQYYSSSDDFQAQTLGTNRARKLQSDSVYYDPMAPSAVGTLSGTFPKATFIFVVEGMGTLSGTVTSSGIPLEGANIQVNDSFHNATSSVSGEFSIPYLLEGDHSLTVHKLGYEDLNLPFTIVENQNTILNIEMSPSSSVSVNGTIVGDDNLDQGLSEAIVTLMGVMDYTATSNALGHFTIPNVLSGNTYEYSIVRAGYYARSGSIDVGSTNYDMGTLTMHELNLPPTAVTATLNDAETLVSLVWQAPNETGNSLSFDFEGDDGGWIASSSWINPLGDWEHTSSYDVANWDPTYLEDNLIPPPTAHSGTGMWGTRINTNYTNSGGFNYLTKTFNLAGLGVNQLRFWSWESIFGDWDYAQVSVNGTVVWGPSWDYAATQWRERIVDLNNFSGLSEVTIQFQMYASTVVNYAGWYIDDVQLVEAEPLMSTSASPQVPLALKGLSESEAALMAVGLSKTMPPAPRRGASDAPPSRIPVGYHVYKLMQGQELNQALWTQITTTPINDTTFVFAGWNTLPDGHHKWAVKTVYAEGLLSNPAFSNMLRRMPNDLAALTVIGNTTPTVGSPSNFVVQIKNTGTSPQVAGAYTVKLYSGTTELASIFGPNIAANQEINVTVMWIPATAGDMQIRARVVLPGDLIQGNDYSNILDLIVLPSGQYGYTVGDGSSLARIPVDMYYNTSLFQALYYPEELGNYMGFLSGIQFYNDFVSDLSNIPTKVYIGTTALNNMYTGWIPADSNHTLVFDGPLNYPAGENTITIPFIEPYLYLNGENLVVTVLRPLEAGIHHQYDRFRSQTRGINRARKIFSNTATYNPATPPAPTAAQLSGSFPMTTFLGISGYVGHLTGTVTGAGNQALGGVQISLNDTSYQGNTNANGEYHIQYILPGTYTATFSRHGYLDFTATVTIDTDETEVLNVSMNILTQVNVNGSILASNTGSGLAGADINLTGYENYSVSSANDGSFTIPTVFANHSYTYSISAPGYALSSGSIDVGAANYSMGNITLSEIAYPPSSLIAAENSTFNGINLNWNTPDPNVNENTEGFEGTVFPPSGWSRFITNANPPHDGGVLPTWCSVSTVFLTGGLIIEPSQGSKQAGLWWDDSPQDEWLLTPAFTCPPDAQFVFDTYAKYGSQYYDHYYVKISTDAGNSWTVLWDATALPPGQNQYVSPIVIDLADYAGMEVKLAFHALGSPEYLGLMYVWFIDNLIIGNSGDQIRFANSQLISSKPAAQIAKTSGGNPAHSTNREMIGYKAWRFVAGQENSEILWVPVSDDLISTLNHVDSSWNTLPDGAYRWAVKAVYTADVMSTPVLSNTIVKELLTGTIIGNVRRQGDNQFIAGATITTEGGFSATTNSAGSYILVVPVGICTVTATAEGYKPLNYDNIFVAPDQYTTLNFQMTPTSNEDEIMPVTITRLNGNYPNPFNPETTISYELKDATNVHLNVYNIKGQLVRSLVNQDQASGRYRVTFNGRDDKGNQLSSGIYLYRFTAGKYSDTRKMMLME